MPKPQSLQNHAATDPLTHFVLLPILLINFIVAIVLAVHHGSDSLALRLWWIVLSLALVLLNMNTRFYSLHLQDRVIRLEERLRLSALLPSADHAMISAFTTAQLIALRFASDEELPALARRTAIENLAPKQIKHAILSWRPDHARV